MKKYTAYLLKTPWLVLSIIPIFSMMACGQQTAQSKIGEIDGVYQFVSQHVTVTKPEKLTDTRSEPEWIGIWQLSQGYFSTILMRKKRTQFAKREKFDDDFDSFGGKYVIRDRTIIFTPTLALRPGFQDRPIRVDFEVREDTLVLTQTLRPHLEDLREGTIVTILRKTNPATPSQQSAGGVIR